MSMNLGTETGSVMNHVMSRATKGQPEPEVGMGVTLLGWTDRYAGTITDIGHDGVITIQEDRCVRTDSNGVSDAQTYSYSRNPSGLVYNFRFRKGLWECVERSEKSGRWIKSLRCSYGLKLGSRNAYYDFSY